ncbi:hypothetical protein CTEN210_11334 [Chaetoceros tenuissimus]|uniref:PH domain-containing protein n=1 Tax=Chaetoceros tenuissimus TaxID=426638 RepID=A0AAD3H9F5_9STRA|nr:hypothetical protein CTEN210_11334 [Chaetoceros tenuissimus]
MTERLIVARSAERMMNSPAHSQAVRSLMDSPTPDSSDDDDSSTSSCDMNYNLCPTDEKSMMHQPLHAHILNGRAIQFDENQQMFQRDQNRYNRTDLKKRQSTKIRSSASGHKPRKEYLQQTPQSVSKAMLKNDLPTLVRSSGSSPSRSRSSLDDIIDDTNKYSTKTPSTAVTAVTQDLTAHNTPLILGSGSNSNFPSSSHTKESHGLFGPTSSNPNSAVVLTSDEERHIRELQNNKLKHFFPNVQLPRPRLLPFSPVLNQGIPVQQQQQQQQKQHVENSMSAAKFAKNAPKAGYLSKLGSSVAEYKKRFFVLKPTTCLYYFLSPNDEEPRGCIDLEGFVDPNDSSGIGGLQVNSLGTLPDGRFRFECVIPLERNDRDSPNSRKILLESRNEEVGREWMEALKTERLSYAKGQHQLLQDQIQVLEKELETMEKNLDNLKLVEQDLEGAMEDSKKWQMRVEKMDDAMRTLKRFMASDSNKSVNESIDTSGDDTGVLSLSKEEHDLDAINLPDSQFASLVNVCRGVKENLRLTSNETDVALDDLRNSNEKLKIVEEKMAKAEKYICKLWEENCSARESIKQRKNEKKILISEVKSLMEKTSSQENEIKRLKLENEKMQRQLGKSAAHSSGQFTTTNSNKIKKLRQLTPHEEKLLFDLEDFVNSSLVEHEYLLDDIEDLPDPTSCDNMEGAGQLLLQTCKKSNVSVDVTDTSRYPHRDYEARDGDSSEELQEEEANEKDEGGKSPKRSFSPLIPKQLPLVENKIKPSKNISLMDQAVLDEKKNAKLVEILRSVSSQALESKDAKSLSSRQELLNISNESKGSDCFEENRKHPLDQLDDNSITSASEPSLKSIPSENGRATSKLVSNTMVQSTPNREENSSGRVYSLTFYSSKIGLQFQNVPTDLKNSGILNDAINVDEHGTTIASDQAETEAELALVKSLSQDTDSSQQVTPAQNRRYLNLRPKHQVLVCGFNGFDAGANSNRKPSLGARLVGYNGVSLEHGPWTFDAVAKVIREQGRPLTLTFRDDNLNREQQAILDKAVKDVLQFSSKSAQQARIPVTINTNSRLSDGSLRNFSRESSNIDDNTTISDYSRYSDNWKSFSEAGSPNMPSSNLLSKLVPGLSRKEKKKNDVHYTPEYFRRSTETLESTPRHKEFKSNLL